MVDNKVAGATTARRGWKRFLPTDPWQVLIGPLLVVIVGAGVTLLISGGGADKAVELQALPPVVQNPPRRDEGLVLTSGSAKGQHADRQTDASKPRIEIRLQNVGTQRAVLTSARFRILRFAVISPCGQGGLLVVSARYDVTLPEGAGSTVEVPIDQQLGPDKADRFVFRLTSQNYFERHVADSLVYEIEISVLHDNSRTPLPVGRVVVSIPGAPEVSNTQTFAPSCSKRPPEAQRKAATFTGARSPDLAAFLRFLQTAGRGA